ncbi:MAG: hypothetical protein LBR32_01220 [Propionibacteriaceae bacterium]|nr:hypothetical protein [Propionibacteriaceae bacterium]
MNVHANLSRAAAAAASSLLLTAGIGQAASASAPTDPAIAATGQTARASARVDAMPGAAAKLTWTTKKADFKTAAASYAYSYELPQFKGVKASVAKAVKAKVKAFFAKTAAERKQADKGLTAETSACLSGSTPWAQAAIDGDIYNNRYFSAFLTRRGLACDTNANWHDELSLTIDLKTGKAAARSKFVDNRKNLFNMEVLAAITKAGDFYDTAYNYSMAPAKWKKVDGWRVSASGVHAYLVDDKGAAYGYLVKWDRVLAPGQTEGKKSTGKVVYTCSDFDVDFDLAYQGDLVKAKSDTVTLYGVRGKAKTILLTQGGKPYLWQLTFASKTSKQATTISALFAC